MLNIRGAFKMQTSLEAVPKNPDLQVGRSAGVGNLVQAAGQMARQLPEKVTKDVGHIR